MDKIRSPLNDIRGSSKIQESLFWQPRSKKVCSGKVSSLNQCFVKILPWSRRIGARCSQNHQENGIDDIDETNSATMILSTLLSTANFALIKRQSLQLELGKSPLQDQYRRILNRSSANSLALQFTDTALSPEKISGHRESLENHSLLPNIDLEQWRNHQNIWLTFPCQLKSF